MYKLIILDRDGVINKDSPEYVRSPEQWHAVPGSLEAIAKLHKCGYKVVVATNQSGIARGYYTPETLEAIHKKMINQVENAGGRLDEIFVCPHGPDDNCDCRKPKPGLLLQAAEKFNVDPSEMVMIGDSMRDIIAAKNCGADAMFIKSDAKTNDSIEVQKLGLPIYENLERAAEAICQLPSS